MNQEVKKKWIEALRSGKYRQGFGSLCPDTYWSTPCYCVMGVLCELAYKEGIITKTEYLARGVKITNYGGNDKVVPDAVVEWSGLESLEVRFQDFNKNLIDLNDLYLVPFNRLADIIEEQL